jgi:transcriptional regulator with XRE-family HTH domain
MPTTTPARSKLKGPMSARLHAARIEAGLSRRALADLIDVSERLVNYYEDTNYARGRKRGYVRRWAEATGRSFEELWGAAGQEISNRTCNGRTSSPFLTRERDAKRTSDSTLPLRRQSA